MKRFDSSIERIQIAMDQDLPAFHHTRPSASKVFEACASLPVTGHRYDSEPARPDKAVR